MKIFFISIGALTALIIGFLIWSSFQPPKERAAVPGVVSSTGLHWHPELLIYVKGEKLEIPQNIGIGVTHSPMHTHTDLPIIHLEFGGLVRNDNVMLGEFFKNWGKDMRSFGPNMRMTVNGEENTEYENYIMHDGDRIELRYE